MKTEEIPPHLKQPGTPTTTSDSLLLSPGQKLGGVYSLEREVPGCEWLVWIAYDEVLGKDVSLHFLPDQIRNNAEIMAAVRQEVKKNRQLIHPNILRVYDLVEEGEWSAISMDSFEGRSLASMLAEKDGKFFEPEDLKPWLQPLCQTLGDVHKIHVIHGNVTPASLIFEKGGKILISNFGIARAIDDVPTQGRKFKDGERQRPYSSPQRLDGTSVAASDDIYSAGATIYELLTGEPPFVGPNLETRVRETAPPSMMERRAQLKKRGGTILPTWENAVAQCLAKNPSDRPASMYELASKLGLGGKLRPEASTSTATAGAATVAAAAAAIAAKPTEKKIESSAPAEGKVAPVIPLKLEEEAGTTHPKSGEVIKKPSETASEGRVPIGKGKRTEKPEGIANPQNTTNKREAGGEVTDPYPSHYPRKSGSPVKAIAAAVLVLAALAAGIYYFGGAGEKQGGSPEAGPETAQVSPDKTAEPTAGGPTSPLPSTAESPKTVSPSLPGAEGAERASDGPNYTAHVAGAEGASPGKQGEPPRGTTATPSGTDRSPAVVPPVAETPRAASDARSDAQPVGTRDKERTQEAESTAAKANKEKIPEIEPLPAAPKLAPQNPAIAKNPGVMAKVAAATEARRIAEATDKAAREAREKQVKAEAAAEEAQKVLDEKAKAAAPSIQAVEELATRRKEREKQLQAAEAAAAQARQIAEEKARQTEEAKKALADFEAQNKEKLAAREKAEAELQSYKASLVERQRISAETAKAFTAANTSRQQQIDTLKRVEEEAVQSIAGAEKATAAVEPQPATDQRSQQRQQIEKEIEDMKRMFEEKMRTLESLKTNGGAPPGQATPQKETPAPAVPSETKPALVPPRPTPVVKAEGTDVGATPTATTPVPPVSAPESSNESQAAQTVASGNENSLGIKFAPVGDIYFAIWPTRVKDYEIFARETKLKATAWRSPGFKQRDDHPVVNVSWNDAISFCKWLTDREHKKGTLAAKQIYRLPTDLEWSKAVGLPDESGKTPEDRDMGVPDVFPWGDQWPPPPNVGNYTGEETGSEVAIKGYDDGYAWTSPVGSFPPNRSGLYDVGGNVWEWCMDSWNNESKAKVLRGASWYNGALKLSLLSSCRVHANPESFTDNFGFRIVRASDTDRPNKR